MAGVSSTQCILSSDIFYFILQQASTKLHHFNLYTDNGFITFLSHIGFRCDSLMTAVDGRNMQDGISYVCLCMCVCAYVCIYIYIYSFIH